MVSHSIFNGHFLCRGSDVTVSPISAAAARFLRRGISNTSQKNKMSLYFYTTRLIKGEVSTKQR